MADMEILDVYIPCRSCGKLIPAGGNNHCLTCRVWKLYLEATDPKWIPVTERLPEEGGDVLVWSEYGFCAVAVRMGTPGKWCIKWYNDFFEVGRITHWMPLPEPPKEGAEDG